MSDACRACPARLVDDAAKLLGSSLNELVPPEAQRHLLIAQRELLLALAATIEHHARSHQDEPEEGEPAGRGGKRTRRGTGRSRRPARVELE